MNRRQIYKWELVQQSRWDMWCNHLMITLRVGGKNCGIMPSLRNSIKQMTFIKVKNGRSRLDQFKHWSRSCNYCFILKSLKMILSMFHWFWSHVFFVHMCFLLKEGPHSMLHCLYLFQCNLLIVYLSILDTWTLFCCLLDASRKCPSVFGKGGPKIINHHLYNKYCY